MRHIDRVLSLIDTINEWAGRVVSFLVIGVVGVIFYQVMCRYVLNRPSIWAQEVSIFIFGVYFVLGCGYMFLHSSHTRCDVLYTRLFPKGKAIADICTAPVFLIFAVTLFVYGFDMALESVRNREVYQSAWAPVYYPIKLAVPVGGFLLLIQGLAKLVRDIKEVVGTNELHMNSEKSAGSTK